MPDSRTLWAYREKLVQTGAAERLFQNFHERLLAQGLITKTGTLVDATFVTVPRQRNTREENASIKAGKAPEDWKDQPDKLRQKDLEARWTLKNHVATYGYKNHVKVDAASKLIVAQKVTPANANDGRQLADLVKARRRQTLTSDILSPNLRTIEVFWAFKSAHQGNEPISTMVDITCFFEIDGVLLVERIGTPLFPANDLFDPAHIYKSQESARHRHNRFPPR